MKINFTPTELATLLELINNNDECICYSSDRYCLAMQSAVKGHGCDICKFVHILDSYKENDADFFSFYLETDDK